MKAVYLEIISLIIILSPIASHAQKFNASYFDSWTHKIIPLKEGQNIQDSLFRCLCLPCDTPTPIERHIRKLSCMPAALLDYNGPYCAGNFRRLSSTELDTNIIPLLFYIEADMDCTKSLVLVIFTKDGVELSSKVIASDDPAFIAKTESKNIKTFRLFQYVLDKNVLYIRECCYNFEYQLVDVTTSAYEITHDGIIKQVDKLDKIYLQKLFSTFTIKDKWSVD
jgi:hypothetical protein